MSYVWNDLNLINLLTFYFLLMTVASIYRRWWQYKEMVQLVVGSSHRWPHLLKLIKEHRTIFLTWRTVAPLALTIGLTVLQLLASQVLWPQAGASATGLTLNTLFLHVPLAALVVTLAAGMLAVDIYFIVVIGSFDRPELEKYFDQAEYWLVSKMAHVVKIVTFGRINPRRKVAEEVQKALVDASNLLNTTLWWVNLQMALRFAFGLSLWIGWWLLK
jgi:hypothetical protein